MQTQQLPSKPTSLSIWLTRLLILYTVVSSAYLLYLAWPFSTDDAYITVRYALHLYQGHGLLWNVGGLRVEGYTNFLYVIFAYLALCLHLSPILFLKTINLVSFYLSLGTLYLIARYWLEPLVAALCALIFSYQMGVLWWTVSGLETITYTFFILTAVLCFFKSIEDRPTFCILAALFTLLAALTRSDGVILFFAICGGYGFHYLKHRQTKTLKSALLYGVVFLLPYGIYFLWRWHYFGRLLPNSAYCKEFLRKGNHTGAYFKTGVEFLNAIWLYAIAALITAILRFNYRVIVIAILILCSVFIYLNTDPILAYHNRYFIPVIGFIFILAAASPYNLLKKCKGLTPSITTQFFIFSSLASIAYFMLHTSMKTLFFKQILSVVLLVALLLACLRIAQRFIHSGAIKRINQLLALSFSFSLIVLGQYLLTHIIPYDVGRYQSKAALRVSIAHYIDQHSTPGASTFIGDVGIIGYLSNRPIADAYCINNPTLTSGQVHGEMTDYFPYLFHQIKPQFIILSRHTHQQLTDNIYYNVYKILKQPYFKAHYKKVKVFAAPDKTEVVYVVFAKAS